MKKHISTHLLRYLFLFIFTMPLLALAQADGDTLIVQAFTYGSPQNAKFFFPTAGKRFQKVLMRYKLKCNPAQNPACGEWDYTTQTFLYQHTGRMDSTLLHQPSFVVNNSSPDTFSYSTTTTYKYVPRWEYHVVYDSTISLTTAAIGQGATTTTQTLNKAFADGKAQYQLTAGELAAANLTAGALTGLRLNFTSAGSAMNNLTVRIKNSAITTLSDSTYETTSFTTVFSGRHAAFNVGWDTISFTTPFTWDGTSNVVVEFDFDNNAPGTADILLADSSIGNIGVVSAVNDYYLNFHDADYINVPASTFANVDSQITISFWQYGDSILEPKNASIFEGYNAQGQRVLNCHLPWSDQNVYWDAGNNAGNVDRLQKLLSAAQYKGKWNHWAFTKNTATGAQNIYLNGQLLSTINNKRASMAGITKFKIGSNGAGTDVFYEGMINEFQVWNKALDSTTIKAYMNKDVDANHPYYSNLQAYYKFDEGTGTIANDASPNNRKGQLMGLPEWRSTYRSQNIRNLASTTVRPYMVLEQGVYRSHIDTVLVFDTIANGQLSIVQYLDTAHPTVPTDTLVVWPVQGMVYVYDGGGNVIDSTFVPGTTTLHLQQLPYYSAPFEVVIPYEIARFITPYGIGLDLGAGWTWVHLSAGNWQELLDMQFVFIYGTPARDVIKIENLWDGDISLNDLATRVTPKTIPIDPAGHTFRAITRITGHGQGGTNNCAEFCFHDHHIYADNQLVDTWSLYKDCGYHELFPQGGTWLYDRDGWCPGEMVPTVNHEITPFVYPGATNVTIGYDSDPEDGYYVFHSQFVTYGQPNFKHDAAMVDVIAPSTQNQYTRFNPRCDNPIVIIQNTGKDTLKQVDITYGVDGGRDCYYTWHGNLSFLSVDTVVLPPFDWAGYDTLNPMFHASVDYPNGTYDQYMYNDTIHTPFKVVPVYDSIVIMQLLTNLDGAESSWELRNEYDSVMYSGSGYGNRVTVRDTFHLQPGCYKFTLFDSGEDGLSFFANNSGNGTIQLRKLVGGIFQIMQPNFGEKISQYFMVGYKQGFGPAKDSCVKPLRVIDTTGIATAVTPEDKVYIYPNPTDNKFFVRLDYAERENATIRIYNTIGTLIEERIVKQASKELLEFQLTNQPTGMYLVEVITDKATTVKRLMLGR